MVFVTVRVLVIVGEKGNVWVGVPVTVLVRVTVIVGVTVGV